MRRGPLLTCFVLSLALAATALAQPGPADQAEEGSPSPALAVDPGGRRAVRGCPADADCVSPSAAMRELEILEWSKQGWISSRPRGSAAGGDHPRPAITRPSQLRPDQAWLDELALPDLPVTWSPRLIDYLLFYKDDPRGRRIMTSWLRAQGRYRDLIVTQLRAAGLPEDLLYVSMIESSYDPGERSYAGAAGLWQFMPAGGRIYGLRIDRWVDERNDPLRSTLAVRDYFADLHQRFADWHLALAAYNAGYGAVLRAITRYNSNDYWKLVEIENGLAWETTLYVPKALAAAIVGRNRARFGYAEVVAAPAESFDTVAVPARSSLASIARLAGASVAEVKRLNPHLLRGRTPPDVRDYVVRVPTGAGPAVGRGRAELTREADGLTTYTVMFGERFEDVATTFGLSTRRLRELNEVAFEGEVTGGAVLVVPALASAQLAANRSKAIDALHASGPDMKPGEPLIVPVPDRDAAVAGRRRVFYRAVAGDALAAVAGALAVDAGELARWNDLAPTAALHPRMILQAFVAPGFDAEAARVRLLDDARLLVVSRGSAEHLDLVEGRLGRTRVAYTAKRKESLEAIGKKYGLGHRDLARINRMPADSVIAAGQTIIVYAVVDRTRSERAAEQWKKTPKSQRGKTGRIAEGTATDPDETTTAPGQGAAAPSKAGGKPQPPEAGAAPHAPSAGPVTDPGQAP